MDRRFRGVLVVLLVGAAGLAIAVEGIAHKSGGTDRDGIEGCGPAGACHPEEEAVQSYVLVRLEGLPETYVTDETYTLKVTTGPVERARKSAPGGYAIDVEATTGVGIPGYFSSIPGDKFSKLAPSSDTMTHTEAGTNQLEWVFNWTAPPSPTLVRFWVTGMLSQGSLLGQDSDVWNTDTWLLNGKAAKSPMPVLGTVLALGVAAMVWRRK